MDLKPRAFLASHEARRRMAAFSIQLTGSSTKPASRGTCRATAVKPRPTCFPSSTPAPDGRGVGCRGSPPAQVGGKDGELAVTGFGGKTG